MIKSRIVKLFTIPPDINKSHIEIWLSYAYECGKNGKWFDNFKIKEIDGQLMIICDEYTEKINVNLEK